MKQSTSADIMNHDDPIERRKFVRFPLKEGAMVALTSVDDESYYVKLGRIMDISRGGLAFKYEGDIDRETKLGILDIFGLVRPYFRLEAVPFRVVYDRGVVSQGGDYQSKPACPRVR